MNAWSIIDRWAIGTGAERREFALTTELSRTVSAAESPLLTLADARIDLQVTLGSVAGT